MIRVRIAALCVRDGKILLARHVKEARVSYLLPGGGLEDDETAHDALLRELREEAGVHAHVGDVRYVIEARAPDASRHLVQIVFDAVIEGTIGASSDPRVTECAWHDVSELRSLPLHPAVGATLADDIEAGAKSCRYILAPWAI